MIELGNIPPLIARGYFNYNPTDIQNLQFGFFIVKRKGKKNFGDQKLIPGPHMATMLKSQFQLR